MTDPTRYVIFTRFSPRPKDKAESTDTCEVQEELCRAYVAKHGGAVDEPVVQEISVSGCDLTEEPNPFVALARRPILWSAIQRCQEGMVLLVHKRDRIARESFLQKGVQRILAKQGAKLEAAGELNGTGLGINVALAVQAEFAEATAAETRIRTALAMRSKMARGYRMGRPDRQPYGFAVDPADASRVVPVPEEQANIAMMLRLRDEGMNCYAICKALAAAGRTKRGGSWLKGWSIVKRILANGKP